MEHTDSLFWLPFLFSSFPFLLPFLLFPLFLIIISSLLNGKYFKEIELWLKITLPDMPLSHVSHQSKIKGLMEKNLSYFLHVYKKNTNL